MLFACTHILQEVFLEKSNYSTTRFSVSSSHVVRYYKCIVFQIKPAITQKRYFWLSFSVKLKNWHPLFIVLMLFFTRRINFRRHNYIAIIKYNKKFYCNVSLKKFLSYIMNNPYIDGLQLTVTKIYNIISNRELPISHLFTMFLYVLSENATLG